MCVLSAETELFCQREGSDQVLHDDPAQPTCQMAPTLINTNGSSDTHQGLHCLVELSLGVQKHILELFK